MTDDQAHYPIIYLFTAAYIRGSFPLDTASNLGADKRSPPDPAFGSRFTQGAGVEGLGGRVG